MTTFRFNGPFVASEGHLSFPGNSVFPPCEDVRNLPVRDMKNYIQNLFEQATHYRALIEIFSALTWIIHECLRESAALEFDLPMLTRMISSPGSLTGTIPSDVAPFRVSYFGKEMFLSQSSQLYLEFALLVPGIKSVYCISKSWRNEPCDFRHLPEFTHVEFESNHDFEANLVHQRKFLTTVIKKLFQQCPAPLEQFRSAVEWDCLLSGIENWAFPQIRFHDAFTVLYQATGNKDYLDPSIAHFGAFEEVLLTQIFDQGPIFVTHYIADEVAFYHENDEENPNLAVNADLLFPGYGELIGSGQRVRTQESTSAKAKHFRLDLADYAPYVLSRQFNSERVHSGWGMGLERLLQCLLGIPVIWLTKTFPRVDQVYP